MKSNNKVDNQSITLHLGHYSCYVGSHIRRLRDQLIVDNEIENNNDNDNNNNDNNNNNENENNENEYYNLNAIYRMSKGKRYPRAMFFDYKDNIRYKPNSYVIANEEAEVRQSSWNGSLNTIFRQNNMNSTSNNNENDINNDLTTFDERKVKTWTNFMNPNKLLSNSICPLPLWTNTSNFDTYCAGATYEHISSLLLETYMDNFRYFAEECDYLSTVNIFSDIFDGFGHLTTRLLEEIREETRSATIPIWMLQGNDSIITTYELQKKKDMLKELNTPICYANMSEHATMIVPINHTNAMSNILPKDRKLFTHFESSALIGTAIETMTSIEYLKKPNNNEGSKWTSIHNLCQGATALGRFQFTGLEISLPFMASYLETSPDLLWDSFVKEKHRNSSNLNPFTLSLSSAAITSSFESNKERRFDNFTNMLSIRGTCNPLLIPTLYQHYPQQSYLLTNVQVLESTIHLPMRYPQCIWNYIENISIEASSSNTNNNMIENIMMNGCPCAASIGSNETMGYHLNNVAKTFHDNSSLSKHQVIIIIIIIFIFIPILTLILILIA
jgi:hypothetical protein